MSLSTVISAITGGTVLQELVVVTCWCGLKHAIPRELREYQLRERCALHCPQGHKYVPAGPTKEETLQRELTFERSRLAAERSRHDQTRSELEATKRQRTALKGKVTKLTHRVANGVCPCCRRTFQNLANHIKNQHPGFKQEYHES